MAATTSAKMGNNDNQNGWAEYSRLVLAELERLSNQLAATQSQGQTAQLTMAQSLNDAKSHILDKLREAIKLIDNEYEQREKELHAEAMKSMEELEMRHNQKITDLKDSLIKQEVALKETAQKLERTDKELISLKAKAAVLGAVAGLAVGIAGFFIKS